MIGLIIASHGRLAEEFLATAKGIVGEVAQVAICEIDAAGGPEAFKRSLREAIQLLDSGQGVLVLADLMGGSPCVQSLTLSSQERIEVVTGMNLPMLIKANTLRQSEADLHALATELVSYGRKHIGCATDAMRARASAA